MKTGLQYLQPLVTSFVYSCWIHFSLFIMINLDSANQQLRAEPVEGHYLHYLHRNLAPV